MKYDETKAKPVLPLGHGKPITRRDLLSHGFISFAAVSALPNSLFGLGLRRAQIANGVADGFIPFMAFDMAGGAALPGNFLVGKQGGPKDFLSSYSSLGWDPMAANALNEDFGIPMSANYSQFLAGLLETVSAGAQANLRMGGICHFAADDTGNNKLNAASLVTATGGVGQFINNGLCTKNTLSGGNSKSALDQASLKPTFVSSIVDVQGATSFGGPGYQGIRPEKMKIMAEQALELAKLQAQAKINQPGGRLLAELADPAYQKSLELLDGATGLDPRLDANASAVYGINQNTSETDPNVVAAALSMNTINGAAGPSVWTLGGCDYHTGNSTRGDEKDLDMGRRVGQAIELAAQLQQPFFFQLLTDGGCDASSGTRNWTGDSGDRCMSVVGYYSPEGPPAMIRQQVGHYTDGQVVDRSTLIGGDPQLAAYAVFANYLNCCGMLSRFHEILPNVFTGAGELDSVLIFEGV